MQKVLNFLKRLVPKSALEDVVAVSFLVKISGWATLFIVNWQIGLACFIIAVGDKMQRNLIDNSINNTLQNLLASVAFLAGKEILKVKEKSQDELETETKKDDENFKNN